MSEPGKAVFLSYASQDAEAAKRICDALRATGVEVWFDQNELVGGDAWDAKIRKQIKECALLIPIISANTQSRTEGYFRLEWRLADQRTHLMAKGRPFLLPVVIDGTRDTEAHVPDSFTEVQWTRLPDGEGGAVFAARVKQLLGGAEMEPARPRPGTGTRGEVAAPPRNPRLGPWLALGGVVVVGLGLFIARPWRHSGPPRVISAEKPAAPLSEARKLAAQALQLLQEPDMTRESSWLADELCDRALRLDASDAEVWAVAAFASLNLYGNIYDTSAARKEKARMQSERARQLDPQSVHAGLAVARYQWRFGSQQESRQLVQALHERAPDNQEVLLTLIEATRAQDDDGQVALLFGQLRALPRTGVLTQALWFDAVRLRNRGRFAAAERLLDEMLAESGAVRGALYEKLVLVTSGWGDLPAGESLIARIPERYRQEPAFGSELALYWMMRGQPAEVLQALALVPQEYLEEFHAREPRALPAGWAHMMAGRPAAAKSEWQSALAVVEARLKDDPRNTALLHQRVLLLALTGQGEAARAAWQPLSELTGGQTSIAWGNAVQILTALDEKDAAVIALERLWGSLNGGAKARLLNQLEHHPAYAPLRPILRVQAIMDEGRRWLQDLKSRAAPRPATRIEGAGPAIAADDKSVAVLAFANLSDDKTNEYFSDGISEELLNVLAKVPGLKVSARTSAFYFKGKEVPVPEIARQLGVAYVVEGSVRKAGDKVRITAQLIKAADGFHVWSDTFTRDLKDIFAVQDEIAGLIAQSLSLKLGTGSSRKVAVVNPQAFELYVQARQAWSLRTSEGFARAEQLLDRALELAPDFVRARAALIDVVQMRSFREGKAGNFGQRNSPEIDQTLAQVRAVLALEPELAEAYSTLGQTLDSKWQREEAGRAYRRATELNPNYATGRHWYGMHLAELGQMDEALAELKAACDLDPFSFIILDNYGWLLNLAGRNREAVRMLDRAAALNPGFDQTARAKATALAALGRAAEAQAIARQLKNSQPELDVWSLGLVGLHDEANALLQRMEPGDVTTRYQAFLAAGQREAALEALADLSGVSKGGVIDLLYQRIYDPLRTEPRFVRFLAALGLTEAHARAQTWRAAHPPDQPEVKP